MRLGDVGEAVTDVAGANWSVRPVPGLRVEDAREVAGPPADVGARAAARRSSAWSVGARAFQRQQNARTTSWTLTKSRRWRPSSNRPRRLIVEQSHGEGREHDAGVSGRVGHTLVRAIDVEQPQCDCRDRIGGTEQQAHRSWSYLPSASIEDNDGRFHSGVGSGVSCWLPARGAPSRASASRPRLRSTPPGAAVGSAVQTLAVDAHAGGDESLPRGGRSSPEQHGGTARVDRRVVGRSHPCADRHRSSGPRDARPRCSRAAPPDRVGIAHVPRINSTRGPGSRGVRQSPCT